METIELLVNGENKTQIQCTKEDLPKVEKILSQLGIYSAFHGYNFQYQTTTENENKKFKLMELTPEIMASRLEKTPFYFKKIENY